MAKYPDVTAGQTEACINRLGGWQNFLRFIGGSGRIVFDSILELVTTVGIPALEEFRPAQKFKVDTSSNARVKIGYIGDNLRGIIARMKSEPAQTEGELAIHRLTQNSVDAPILAELEDKAVTSLSTLWILLEKQGNGEEGSLLTTGFANILYISEEGEKNDGEKEIVVWAVRAGWYAESGWDLSAYPVTSPDRWSADGQVVSRN